MAKEQRPKMVCKKSKNGRCLTCAGVLVSRNNAKIDFLAIARALKIAAIKKRIEKNASVTTNACRLKAA